MGKLLQLSALALGTFIFASTQAANTTPTRPQHSNINTWWHKAWDSNKYFYTNKRNLFRLGAGIAVNAVLANSSIDQDFTNWYQRHVRNGFTNDVSKVSKPFGTLPIVALGYAGAVGLSYFTYGTKFGGTFGRWTSNSLQAIVIGAVPVLVLQRVIGSNRPEANKGSDWHFMGEPHGVSGHAFLGAIPFLTAAKMSTRWYTKAAWYTASALPGLSRINDNKHYLSQVVLGWWIANLSENAVFHVENSTVQISPMYVDHGVGAQVRVAM